MKPLGEIKRLNPAGTLEQRGYRLHALATLAAHLTVKSALMSVLLTGEVRVMPDEEGA